MSYAEHNDGMAQAYKVRIAELEAALQPFAWLADNLYPPAVDLMFGEGFFDNLEKAKAVLAKA